MEVRMSLLLAVRQSQNDKIKHPHFRMWCESRVRCAETYEFNFPPDSNSIPPTTTVENLLVKEQAAKGKLHVDVGFWGGIIPGNEKQLLPMLDHGVVGFKCFLCPSGVEEFPNVDKNSIDLAYHELKDSNALVAVCSLIKLSQLLHDLWTNFDYRFSVSCRNMWWSQPLGQWSFLLSWWRKSSGIRDLLEDKTSYLGTECHRFYCASSCQIWHVDIVRIFNCSIFCDYSMLFLFRKAFALTLFICRPLRLCQRFAICANKLANVWPLKLVIIIWRLPRKMYHMAESISNAVHRFETVIIANNCGKQSNRMTSTWWCRIIRQAHPNWNY